ncbi:RPC34 [Candida oxycetoniae]|uniref:DNA-directed RNA polymerase III subunit RPC6 n=1 Tax=Candida oxycetoniae TaxID=497107 RepID=A0AAI9SUF0_9ASCO|nr:RPC34 [Candida oxycetoniae]KAI3403033.2 RPC34 [Candida oxycetoniae]
MREVHSTELISIEDIYKLINIEKESDLLVILQELVNNKLVKLLQRGDQKLLQAVTAEEGKRVTQMSDDEHMIYKYISASGREGIWTKTIKNKSNLHQHIVTKCLKNLENMRFIKTVKSVKYPTRKIYMLYNLQPSLDVSGGPWFTNGEFDSIFINDTTAAIWSYIYMSTVPGFRKYVDNPLQPGYPADYPGVSIDQIMNYGREHNFFRGVEIELSDLQKLCNVLVYDDKIEQVGQDNEGEVYKITGSSLNEYNLGIDTKWLGNVMPTSSGNYIKMPEPAREYLAKHYSFNLFDYNTEKIDYEKEQDVVYLDAYLNS